MDHNCYLRRIKASLAPSTGCTEPAAIALNAATARANVRGSILRVRARLDAYLWAWAAPARMSAAGACAWRWASRRATRRRV